MPVSDNLSNIQSNSSNSQQAQSDETPFLQDWGFTLKELYGLALLFFKDKEGKAMHFTYEERLRLIALTCQVAHGKFDPSNAPPLGVLDVIGKDRRTSWQALGDKSKSDSMFEFITTLSKQSPSFKPFIEAHKRDAEAKTKKNLESQEVENEKELSYQEAKEIERVEEDKNYHELEQKRRVQDALNRQTFEQFKSYADQQYPGNPEQQGVLIRQLQDQHYEQYMRQIYKQQEMFSQEDQTSSNGNNCSNNVILSNTSQEMVPSLEENDERGDNESDGEENSMAAASMWTRKDINEFKESVRSEGGEGIIRVGQGESITVRVPTHDDGSCLFWEFATDSYDVGFGLFFEWTDGDESVSVQVTDENTSDDEEEDEELAAIQQDIEKGSELLPKGSKPNTDIIIPVFRRDAHTEVYVGSHLFPGKGVYILKFDNSYSFWRSKTLYYRVYYTK